MRHCQQHWLELIDIYFQSTYLILEENSQNGSAPCLDLKKMNLGIGLKKWLCFESVNVNPRLSFSERCSLVLQLPLQKMQG